MSRNKISFSILKDNQKILKPKSLNNFDLLRTHSSLNKFMDKFKDNKNVIKKNFFKNGKNFIIFLT